MNLTTAYRDSARRVRADIDKMSKEHARGKNTGNASDKGLAIFLDCWPDLSEEAKGELCTMCAMIRGHALAMGANQFGAGSAASMLVTLIREGLLPLEGIE